MSLGAVSDVSTLSPSSALRSSIEGIDPFVFSDPVILRRFTSEELARIVEAGIFAAAGLLELRNGILFSQESNIPIRITTADYYRLGELGVLKHNERVELIDGVIYSMCPIGSGHSGTLDFLADELRDRLRGRARIRAQQPIHLPNDTEPQPDIAVVRPRNDYYRGEHPQPADIFLLVEIMQSSAPYDRGIKLLAYARAGIPEVWLADLRGERLEIHRKPVDGVYTESFVRSRGQTVSPEAFADIVLTVDEILD